MKENLDTALVISELEPIEKKIRQSEALSIPDRWEFGRVLIKLRPAGKKQLPNGKRADIAEHFDLEASEITRRMQLADKFTTEQEVVDASTRCGDSWARLYREELVTTPRKRTDKPWGDRIEKYLNRKIDDAETEGQYATLAELFRKALARVEAAE